MARQPRILRRWLGLARVLVPLLALCLPFGAAPAHGQALLYADHPLVGKLWDTASHGYIDEAALLARLAQVDVLLLGETHGNPVHHQHQLRLLQARLAAGARPALLMEQFDSERQSALDGVLARRDREDALDAAAGLSKGWDWRFYGPLVAAAFDHQLPVLAANLSRASAQPVIRQGFAAFDAAEFKRLAVEAAWSEPRQQYLQRLIEDSHCGQISAELRDGLVRGQRLRDAVMADSALASLERGAAGVIGIIGRGHARRDIGLPIYLAARRPATRIYSIGFVEVAADKHSPEAYETESATAGAPHDILWFSPRSERADPCAAFGKK